MTDSFATPVPARWLTRHGTVTSTLAGRGKYVVQVFRPDGEAICYCGPYCEIEARRTVDLFRNAGWLLIG